MTQWVSINVNAHVKIRLRERGKQILRDQQYPLSPLEDEDGWSTWQLWIVMQLFGPHFNMCLDPPFETTIQVIPEEEK